MAAGVAERLRLEVDQLAATGPSTTAALARQLGVTERTVRRDFELLRQAGIIEAAAVAAHYQLLG
ncbi:HTH domain-containing protein [Hymenobacter artigasi]|uniref:DeoR/GlpR family transcriptional regulator of sugar metabolism n=1 Tax=Hymenobacter artigasi TaxID=2719616 RepID=A0ABX1HMT1_9BACT|nr:HTH domain-containing protein [Hymenobacter artigasi]NKI91564.1 DeoR/GlpR family transcriptional regulator of sugar metabolism [Hymenobacter artigasi]